MMSGSISLVKSAQAGVTSFGYAQDRLCTQYSCSFCPKGSVNREISIQN